MMVHPVALAVAVCDAAVVVLLGMAMVTAARVVVGWRPAAPTGGQLRLERQAEGASLQVRWALGIFTLGSVILVVALAGVLPTLVPGAMCGTGVVQATGGLATRALGLRLAALGLLGAWQLHDRFDRSAPTSPLAILGARLILLAVPVTVLAVVNTAAGLASLDIETPVDCCAVVFDQVGSLTEARTTAGVSDEALTLFTVVAGGLLAGLAGWILVVPRRLLVLRAASMGLLTVVAVPMAAVGLVRVFSAYHYGVLHHHCPWCLFLAEHWLVGYPLFGALLVVLFDGVGVFLAARVAVREPILHAAGLARVRQGALRLLLAVLVFAVLAGGPALVWRLRYGVWMSG